jgi:hypothetical protein
VLSALTVRDSLLTSAVSSCVDAGHERALTAAVVPIRPGPSLAKRMRALVEECATIDEAALLDERYPSERQAKMR